MNNFEIVLLQKFNKLLLEKIVLIEKKVNDKNKTDREKLEEIKKILSDQELI